MQVKEIVQHAAKACDSKRGQDIVALDMRNLSFVADYYVICHGSSERQVQAIARAVKEAMGELNLSIKRLEGFDSARWVLVDIGDVVCHVFHKDERPYYNLEKLWGDAPTLPLQLDQEG